MHLDTSPKWGRTTVRRRTTGITEIRKKTTQQLQGLPEKCATLATYGLLGATPITTVIEKNTLNVFYNIARHEDLIEHEIALGN